MAMRVPHRCPGHAQATAALAALAFAVAGCSATAGPAPNDAAGASDAATDTDVAARQAADANCATVGTRWCDNGRAVLALAGCATQLVEDCLWNGKYCQFGACLDEPCSADGQGCDSGKVVRCKDGAVTVLADCAAGGGTCAKGTCTHPQCAKYPQTCKAGQVWDCNPKTGLYDVAAGPCEAPDKCTGIGCLPGCSADYKQPPLQCSPDGKAAYNCGDGWSNQFPLSITVCAAPTSVCAAGKCVAPCKAAGSSCLDNGTAQHCGGGPVPKTEVCAEPTPHCLNGKCVRVCGGEPPKQCLNVSYSPKIAMVCDGGPVAKLTDCGYDLCINGECVAKQCSYQEAKCVGNAAVGCSYLGYWQAPVPCPVGTQCTDGLCVARPCAIGAVGCQGQSLATCGTSSVAVGQPCPQGTLCEGGACLANCSASWARCDGSIARNCTNGAAVKSDQCSDKPEACQVFFGQASCANCEGQTGCAGGWIINCSYSEKVAQAWCPPPAKCSAGSCSAPQLAQKCAIDKVCQGDALFRCNPATGQLKQTVLCAGAYEECKEGWYSACSAAKCHVGLSTCVGDAVESCSDGYYPASVSPCPADKICQDGGCVIPACKPPVLPGVPGMRVVGVQWLAAGEGCDLDTLPGADNQAHKLGPWLPPASLQAGLALGAVATFVQLTQGATPMLQVFAATQNPPPDSAAWTALPDTFDRKAQTSATCPARTALTLNADGWYHGGQTLQWLPLRVASGELRLPLANMRAKLAQGQEAGTQTLLVCGWSPKLHFNQQIAKLPLQAETLLGLTARQVHDALDEALLPLGDPDGDGVVDATPLAFQLTLKP